jgi:CheY-like chemotaxis protein
MFLEEYVRTLHANFSTYYYDDLFGAKGYKVLLPDVMIFDHRYARRKGYLNTIQSLDCNIVLVTTHDLKRQINQYIHKFESIILSPLTLDKTRNVLEQFYKKEKELWVKRVEEKTVAFENTEVLVVEDNQINQKLIKAVLERFNVNVTLASNGLEALDVIEKNRFDLVFMDIEMPVMDGVEATKKILQYEVQNRLEHVPIVALTANAVIGDQERYMRAGVDHYLSKPIRLQKLQYVLEKYLKEED